MMERPARRNSTRLRTMDVSQRGEPATAAARKPMRHYFAESAPKPLAADEPAPETGGAAI